MMYNVWARISNGLVREVTHDDPANRYAANLQWVQAVGSVTGNNNVSGGNVDVVSPYWTYINGYFNPPTTGVKIPRPQGTALYVNQFQFTGQGAHVWRELGNVSILSSSGVAHFLSYSVDVFDGNLVPPGSPVEPPNGGGTGGGGGGAFPDNEPGGGGRQE